MTINISAASAKGIRYSAVLLNLMVLFVLGAILKEIPYARLIFGVAMVTTLLSSILAVTQKGLSKVLAIGLGAAAIVFEGLYAYSHDQIYINIALLIECPFFLLITLVLLKDLFTAKTISTDTIIGAICVYILIGVSWSFLYLFIEMYMPGSFSHTASVTDALYSNDLRSSFFYFSFITLATVGYGDIVPIHNISRLLSIFEAICGQMYVAILVARLVGLNISSSFNKANIAIGKE